MNLLIIITFVFEKKKDQTNSLQLILTFGYSVDLL